MSEDSNAEAVLHVLDKWFDRKVRERYRRDDVHLLKGIMSRRARRQLITAGRYSFGGDFAFTFPNKRNYFTWFYCRKGGYFSGSPESIDKQDTTILKTLVPVYSMVGKVEDLASEMRKRAGGRSPAFLDDREIDEAFASAFGSLDEFADFCTAYLRTRLITADLRSRNGTLDEIAYEAQARNYKVVRELVWTFSYIVFGNILN